MMQVTSVHKNWTKRKIAGIMAIASLLIAVFLLVSTVCVITSVPEDEWSRGIYSVLFSALLYSPIGILVCMALAFCLQVSDDDREWRLLLQEPPPEKADPRKWLNAPELEELPCQKCRSNVVAFEEGGMQTIIVGREQSCHECIELKAA